MEREVVRAEAASQPEHAAQRRAEHPVLALQRQVGNRAARAVLAREPSTYEIRLSGMEPIEIESFSYNMTTPRGAAGTGAGESDASKQRVTGVTVTARVGKHSAKLAQAVAAGDGFETAVLVVRRSGSGGKDVFLTVTLKKPYIASYSISGHGSGQDNAPLETWSLAAESIDFNYTAPAPAP